MEIDGVRFTVEKSEGNEIMIVMKGRELSSAVVPNEILKDGVPLPQIMAKRPEAKFTASVLNRFIYRSTKLLASEPVNAQRTRPANTIVINDVSSNDVSVDNDISVND
jgi:2,3-bisphosphoglycerate-independent phosphoglycerate mutase